MLKDYISLLEGCRSFPASNARDYLLTNNTTSFTIDAPGRGVVILTEAFLAGDFVARINGARAKYFRVNHAFRGIEVPGPGIYRISYSYWPRYFTSSLIMGGLGVLEFSVWLAVSFGLTKVPSPAQISGENNLVVVR
jgi:uncharacterized membrane protein YfhO